MIRSTVIVEGNTLDLLQDIATEFSYSISDIREPDKRKTDFSKTIELPGTPKNNAVFAQLFDINIENDWTPSQANVGYNFNPNKVAKTIILVDGIEVFNGVIRVLKVTINNGEVKYETNVLGRLADILFAFGDKKLSDVDLSDLDHDLEMSEIQGSWTAPQGQGYVYPLIDYGLSPDSVKYPIGGFAPAVYVKEYIDRMFTLAEFTYVSPFFTTPYFKSLIIPSTEVVEFTQSAAESVFLKCYSRQRDDQNKRVGEWREIANLWGNTPPKVDKYGMITINTADNGIGSAITFRRDMETSVQFSFRYKASRDGYIRVRLNEAEIFSKASGIYSLPHTEIIEIPRRKYVNGDILRLSIDFHPKAKSTFYPETFVVMPSPTDDTPYPIGVGAPVVMSRFQSKSVALKDFFKSILLMHNLYVFTDPADPNNLFITPQNSFYDSFAGSAVDWTNKVDYSKEIEITPMGELTAREFLLTYKKDSDYYMDDQYFKIFNEVFGQKSYVVDNDFEKETKKIEVIFSPTASVNIAGSNRVIPHIYKVDKDGVKSRDTFNIRILQYGGTYRSYQNEDTPNPLAATWYITDADLNIIQGFNTYPYAGMWDAPYAASRDLCFGPARSLFFTPTIYNDVGLYKYYWEDFILEIANKDSKLWRGHMLLTPADINQLDFKKLVKVDNTYFKLNKIDQYNPLANEVTRVELFKTATQVEIERPGFWKWSDDGYVLHSDESPARIPYA